MKKMLNNFNVAGYLYQVDLKKNTVKKESSKNFGKSFISGNIEVATDEDITNIIRINFQYVLPQYASGKSNYLYKTLNDFLENRDEYTYIAVGEHKCKRIEVTGKILTNDFYNKDGELISSIQNVGERINAIKGDVYFKNTFKVDFLATSFVNNSADNKKSVVNGYTFNWNGSLNPVRFKLSNEKGIEFFEEQNISPSSPCFGMVNGTITNKSMVVKVQKSDKEAVFGEILVDEQTRQIKEHLINAMENTYTIGDGEVLSFEEINKLKQEREVYLAGQKERQEEYKKQQEEKNNIPDSPFSDDGDFLF